MFEFKLTEQAEELMDLSLNNPTIAKYDFCPRRMTNGANGFDLAACLKDQEVIYPNEVVKIPLGVAISLSNEDLVGKTAGFNAPFAFAGLLLPRSSNKMFILNNTVGLLDSDYKNELFAKVRNIGEEILVIKPGERIIQLVVILTYTGDFTKVTNLGESNRKGGDGSTGKY
jgi:dUTP pyrophosphatase